jgi:hypothetical protein
MRKSCILIGSYFQTLSGVLRMFGLLIGSFFFGWLSDAVGRVPSLVAAGVTLLLSQGNQTVALIKKIKSIIVLFISPFRIATLNANKDR